MRLRKQDYAWTVLRKNIEKYKEQQDINIKNEIINDHFYQTILENAGASGAYLKKDLSKITFEEAIEYGRYSSDNDKFELLLQENKHLTDSDCYEHDMRSITMYLPKKKIVENIFKFSIDNFCPIGSNTIVDENLISNDRLKALVDKEKLDPSNAFEIQSKIKRSNITESDLDMILSPEGLELMNRNYVSGWYMVVWLQNKLPNVTSGDFLEALTGGKIIPDIDSYLDNPELYNQKILEYNETTLSGENSDYSSDEN
ncbi:MAG: hypothetical protein RCG15_02480 [Candidatus Rickettsia vulgarisii]